MNRFCLECGAKAQPSDLVCTECGTKFVEQEQVQPDIIVKNNKTPMTKKNKVIALLAVLFISVLVGLYLFGNSYASAENTLKRFHKVVVGKDSKAIKKLVEFEDGAELSKGDVKAIIAFGDKEPKKFTKSIGSWGDVSDSFLFAIKQSGKVFGLFDGYKIIVPNQYVSVPFQYEELEYTLNGAKLKMAIEDGRAVIGPVAPGIYELNAEYKGEYAEFIQTKQIELLEPYGEVVFAELDFDISDVTFRLNFSYGVDPSKTRILIGAKELAFDQEGTIESAGPFPLDGSVKVKAISEFPWGVVETEDIIVDESYISINIHGLNHDVEKEIVDTVLAYGEQYIASRATANSNDVTTVTNEWKKVMQESYDYESENKGYFSGQLDEIQVDLERAQVLEDVDTFRVTVPVSFSLQGALNQNGKGAKLSAEVESCLIEIVYVEDEWKVAKCELDWFSEEAGGTIVEASKTLHKASKEEAVNLETSMWGGYWQVEDKQINGNLAIYDETEEGFYFDIHVASGHVGDMQNVYALKDGNVAKSIKDEYGCVITLTKNDGEISTEEGPDCWAWHGAGINFDHTFKFVEGGLVQFAIDEAFLDIIKQGFLVKGTYPLGTKLKTIINEKGAYNQVENLQGATYHFYGNGIGYGTFIYDEVDEEDVISIMVGSAHDYTRGELVTYLGEPSFEFEDASEGYGLIIGYAFENGFELQFRYVMNSDRLGVVVLTDKGD
ncbi:hypothetical protein JSQ81_16210 [Sporosarcina sp. Marseille-Q4063]|uniref:zinc ribbon domain-containing protein n=1 Tax=Sporosarcina sp. Marseille-Q4063 TaxID=2810514 RepID=UPI001BAF668B|nr:hypothetical protein [Sporosarcina sp. Marseille-Q4063]QUW21333.1 hypothetical protein JSQ81_16210 [Sporosarcina sp. Marseille-Q4063]